MALFQSHGQRRVIWAEDNDIQSAVDHCLSQSTAEWTIVLRAGVTYKPSAPIVIASSTLAGISIIGETPCYPGLGAQTAKISCSWKDAPGIIVQGGRGVLLEDFEIIGQNDYSGTVISAETLLNDSSFLADGVRDNRYSPYAGICFDPFINGNPGGSAANQYPGLSRYYTSTYSLASAGGNYIHRVAISKFNIGIMNSPSGDPNMLGGDNLYVQDCYFTHCRIGFASGQPQTKSNTLINCHFTYGMCFVDGVRYGQQKGYAPIIRGGDCGAVQRLFTLTSGWGPLDVQSLFCETFLGLGTIGWNTTGVPTTAAFRDCVFDFWEPQTTRAPDVHAIIKMPAIFSGGRITNHNALRNVLRIHNTVPVIFDGTAIQYFDWAGRGPTIVFHNPDLVDMRRVQLYDTVNGKYYKQGAPIDKPSVTALGVVTVASLGDHRATFKLSGAGSVLAQGDLIFPSSIGDSYIPRNDPSLIELTDCAYGVVESIAGDTVTIHRVPESLALPKRNLTVERRRFTSS